MAAAATATTHASASASVAVAVAAAFAVMLALDIPWVVLNTRYGVYRELVNGRVRHWVAVLGLWLLVLVLNAVVIGYSMQSETRWWGALLYGAFLGLATYGTFNATALVTFSSWTWTAACVDTAWGTLLFGAAATAAFGAAQLVN